MDQSSIILAVVMVIFSALFSGSEIAFVQSSRVRMAIDAARGGLIDRILHLFTVREDMFLSTLLVGNNIVLVVYGIALSALINPVLEGWFGNNEALVLICNTLFSTGVILIAGEFLPKTIFRINPNMMMRACGFPLYLIYLVLYPVSLLVSGISRGLMRICGIQEAGPVSASLTIEQLDSYLEQNIDTTVDSKQVVDNEVKIFHNAIDFKDTQIGECMIPRNEIVAVPLEKTTAEELRKRFIATGLSKIVVYKEDIDDIVGYIHIAEMFTPEVEWTSCLKPVIHTPETMLANKMMRRMISEKRSVVIVVDEFGGTAGLVTLEDLVEEIFGEIEDEHDRDRSWARTLADGVYEFAGRAEISAIRDDYGLDLRESEEYHTLAGYLLYNLGALPAEGEEYDINGLKFKVLKMTDSRVLLVEVRDVAE